MFCVRRFLGVVLCAASAGCSRDYTLPDPPQAGTVLGKLELSDGSPGANVEVRLAPLDGDALTRTTDAQGAFTFEATPGVYSFRADPGGFVAIQLLVSVVSGGRRDLGTLKLEALGGGDSFLTGKVAINGGAGDVTGAEVEASVQSTGQQIAKLAVGSSGEFTLRLNPGTYTLKASHPFYVSPAPRTNIALMDKQRLDLTAQPLLLDLNPATVRGRVLKERDLSADRIEAAGAVVTSDTGATATADMAGNFNLQGLPAGTRTLTVTLKGFHDAVPVRTVTVAPAEVKTVGDLELLIDRGELTGEVLMKDNTPLRDVTASVDLVVPDGGAPDGGTARPYSAAVAPSNNNPSRGSFVIKGVPVGFWSVKADRNNYITATSAPVEVTALRTSNAGLLELARAVGDFIIDDNDNTNAPGFTRQRDVVLRLLSVGTAVEYRASDVDPTLQSAAFSPFGARPDGGTVTPNNIPFTLGGNDGIKTIYLQYRDTMGNLSAPLNASVVLDTVAPASPSLQLEEGRDFTRSNGTLLATVSAVDPRGTMVDNVSGVGFVKLAAAPTVGSDGQLLAPRQSYAPTLSFQRPTTVDGVQLVYAQFLDNAGNASAVVSDEVTVDTVPPTGSLSISRGPKATEDSVTNTPLTDLKIQVGPEPDGGYVQVKLANETAADLSASVLQRVRASMAWFIEPTEGSRTVHYVLVDAAGNSSGQAFQTIRYDTTPPTGSVSLSSGTPTRSVNATLALSAVDVGGALSPDAGLTLSEDPTFSTASTVGPMPFASTRGFTLSSGDGPKTVYARFRDSAGNDSVSSVAVTLDQTPPLGSISLEGTLADGTVSTTHTAQGTVTVRVQQTGASHLFLGNETLTDCASAGPYVALVGTSISAHPLSGAANPRQVRACLRDEAGNTVGPSTATLILDTQAPSGCTLSLQGYQKGGAPAPAGRTALSDITATVAGCSEAPVEMWLTSSNVACTPTVAAAWVPFSASSVFQLLGSDGTTVLRGCVRDAARNTASLNSVSMTLDTTPPTLFPTLVLDMGATFVNQAQVTSRGGFVANASAVVTGATEWALSETNPPTSFVAYSGASTPFTFAGGGPRILYAQFRDDVNNVSLVVSDSIEFDVTAPTGAMGMGSPSITVTGSLADGTPSTSVTTTTNVSVLATVEGASEYLLGNESLTACPNSGYLPLTDLNITGQTLTGAASPRQMRACFRDPAGNTVGPVVDTIVLDATAPTGCTPTLSGFKRDVSTAPAGLTALNFVRGDVAGCVEPPAEIFTTESPVTCSASSSYPWVPFTSTINFVLSAGDGLKTVRGCARDSAGNVASLTAATITLDTTGPIAISVVINGGAAYVNQSQVSGGTTNLTLTGSASGAVEWAADETSSPSNWVSVATNPRILTVPVTSDGVRTVTALFRDELQNPSAAVQDTITVDTVPPSILSSQMRIITTAPLDTFTNTPSINLAVSYPSDAVEAFIGERLGSGACAPSDLAASPAQAVVSSYGFSVTNSEGLKRVCLLFKDAAGNSSSILEDTVALDMTPPTTPQIITPDQYTRDVNLAAFQVTIAAPSFDLAFLTYEKLGGLAFTGVPITSWTPTAALPSGTAFQFYEANDGGETGVRNEFRLRAKDAAGNVSGESSVVVTADTNAPDPVTSRPEWIDNGNGKATLYWKEPSSGAVPDLSHYLVFYGAAPTFLDFEAAAFASEGVSPVRIAPRLNTTLSGLPNGSTAYVRVRGVDLAGNVGHWLPDAGTLPLKLQPGEVSPNELSVLNLPGGAERVQRMARQGSALYALTSGATCSTTFATAFSLLAINMLELASPVQRGFAQSTWASPVIAATQTFESATCLTEGSNGDLIADGHWLFVLTPARLRVFEMNQPLSLPTPAVDIDLTGATIEAGSRALNMHLLGDKLVITGQRSAGGFYVAVLNLADLYDGNAATTVTVADFVAAAPPPRALLAGPVFFAAPTASVVSHERLMILAKDPSSALAMTYQVNLNPALTGAALPTWPGTTFTAGTAASSRLPASGNLVYYGGSNLGLTTFDVSSASGPWAGGTDMTVVTTTAYTTAGQFELQGSQVYLPESGSGLRVLDLALPSQTRDIGFYSAASSGVHTFGNYGALAAVGQLRFLELAAARGLRTVTTEPGAGYHPTVSGAFLFTGMGYLFDLQNGAGPVRPAGINMPQPPCALASTAADEIEITSRGDGFNVFNLEAGTDRIPATINYTMTPVTVPAASGRVTDVELFGNHLIVAEVRPAGVFLEVWRAGKARNRSGVAMSPLTDIAGTTVAITTATGPNLVANIAVAPGGRVAVGLETNSVIPGSSGRGSNLYFVELNALLDDSAATSAVTVHGPVNLSTTAPFGTEPVTDVAIQGNYAYVATLNGVYVVDISVVTNTNPDTFAAAPAVPLFGSALVGNAFDGVYVAGSTLLVTPGERAGVQSLERGLYSLDVTAPLGPEVQGFLQAVLPSHTCAHLNDTARRMRARIAVAGSRAYFTHSGAVRVVELE